MKPNGRQPGINWALPRAVWNRCFGIGALFLVAMLGSVAAPPGHATGTNFTASARVLPAATVESRTLPHVHEESHGLGPRKDLVPLRLHSSADSSDLGRGQILSSCQGDKHCPEPGSLAVLTINGPAYQAFALTLPNKQQVRHRLNHLGQSQVILPMTAWQGVAAIEEFKDDRLLVLVNYE